VGELLTEVPFDSDPPYAAVRADAKLKSEDPVGYEGESVIVWWGILDTGTGIDDESVTWTLDGANIENGGFSYSASWISSQYEMGGSISFYGLPSGSHTFKVAGWDYSGNAVESETTFVVLPTTLQTKGGVAVVSLAIAAFVGGLAVVVVYVLEERRRTMQQKRPEESGDKPQGDDKQPPAP
jgi:hypothetical protein